VPPGNQIGGRVAHISNPATSGTQNAGEPSANGGGQMGVQGAQAPMAGGVGGVPPQNQKRGRVAHISNPATSGAQNAGEPSAHGGGQMRVQGRSPHGGGAVGGVPPQILKGASSQPQQLAHEWGQKRRRILSQRGWAKEVNPPLKNPRWTRKSVGLPLEQAPGFWLL